MDQPAQNIHYCVTHPDIETGLSCARCEKYICPRCMVQSVIGARCPDCAQTKKLPTFEVTPIYYVRAYAAGIGIALLTGLVWALVRIMLGGYLSGILVIGVGYLVGEVISRVVNRKRGSGLAWIAGTSVVLAFTVSGFIWAGPTGLHLLTRDIFGLIFLVVAVFIAVDRVR